MLTRDIAKEQFAKHNLLERYNVKKDFMPNGNEETNIIVDRETGEFLLDIGWYGVEKKVDEFVESLNYEKRQTKIEDAIKVICDGEILRKKQ